MLKGAENNLAKSEKSVAFEEGKINLDPIKSYFNKKDNKFYFEILQKYETQIQDELTYSFCNSNTQDEFGENTPLSEAKKNMRLMNYLAKTGILTGDKLVDADDVESVIEICLKEKYGSLLRVGPIPLYLANFDMRPGKDSTLGQSIVVENKIIGIVVFSHAKEGEVEKFREIVRHELIHTINSILKNREILNINKEPNLAKKTVTQYFIDEFAAYINDHSSSIKNTPLTKINVIQNLTYFNNIKDKILPSPAFDKKEKDEIFTIEQDMEIISKVWYRIYNLIDNNFFGIPDIKYRISNFLLFGGIKQFEDLDLMLPESRQKFIAGMNLPLQFKQIFEDQILEFLNEIV